MACTQLGYPLLGNLFYAQELPDVAVEARYTNVTCFGNETSLSECSYDLVDGQCPSGGAGLLCLNGKLRKSFCF